MDIPESPFSNKEEPATDRQEIVEKGSHDFESSREVSGYSSSVEGDSHEIKEIRQKIAVIDENNEIDSAMANLEESLRFHHVGEGIPVPLEAKDKELLEKTARVGAKKLEKNCELGFGIFPSANPEENFYEQLWTRDFAQASGEFFATHNYKITKDSLETIFSHQRPDGMLPLRVEKQYMMLKLTPGFRRLSKPIFNLIEGRFRGRKERPVYEGQDFSGAEDTVPAAIIAAGEFFIASAEGRDFVGKNFDKLKKAVDFFETKTDPDDGLVSVITGNADWLDSIKRNGKLGGINVLWARSLRLMSFMSSQLDREDDASLYKDKFHHVRASIIEKLYDKEGAYFRAEEGTDRVEATASVFGSLFLLGPAECARVQETLKGRLKKPSGLQNFDPPYSNKQVMWPHKVIGLEGYQNEFVWPWVTCENIHVKIKIAKDHQDSDIREQYKKEAVDDLLDLAKLYRDAGGSYEIFEPETRKPVKKMFYKPPKDFMANLASYESVYSQLRSLGWI